MVTPLGDPTAKLDFFSDGCGAKFTAIVGTLRTFRSAMVAVARGVARLHHDSLNVASLVRPFQVRSPNFSRTGQLSSCFSWELLWDAGPYYQRVSELFEKASRLIVVVGWQLDSRLILGTDGETLRRKLLRLVQEKPDLHVACLLWDHAYFYSLERENWQARIWEDLHPRIHFIFDNQVPFGGSHHEKIILIDEEIALLGGVDLCKARWDSVHHHPRDPRRTKHGFAKADLPHHDVGVQVTGPVVADIYRQIRERWDRVSRQPLPEPRTPPSSPPDAQLHNVLRSRTEAPLLRSRITREIEHCFRWLIAQAKDHILIENQYYWSPELHEVLIAKLRSTPQLRLTLILPFPIIYAGLARLMEHYELELLAQLARINTEPDPIVKDRVQIFFPVAIGENNVRNPIYIHSKVLVIDDRFLSIGSANFASRSLRVDTETNLTFLAETAEQRQKIRSLNKQILDHWNYNRPNASPNLVRVSPDQARRQRVREFNPLYRLGKPRLWKELMDPSFPIRFGFWGNRRKSPLSLPLTNGVLVGAAIWVLQAMLISASAAHPDYSRAENQILFLTALSFQTLWFAHFPLILGLVLACVALPAFYASRLIVLSLWMNSLTILAICTFSPLLAATLYRESSGQLIRFQFRRLPSFISAFLDPRVSIRSKLIDQARAALPFPWILLGSLSLLPAMIYLSTHVLGALIPAEWRAGLTPFAVMGLTGLMLWSLRDLYLLLKTAPRARQGKLP